MRAGILLFFLGLYGLTFHGYVDVEDTELAYQSAVSLVERGTLALANEATARRATEAGFWVVTNESGVFPIQPLAQIALPIPPMLLARELAPFAREKPEEVIRLGYASWNVLAGALLCVVILSITRRLGYRAGTSVATALCAGSCTMLWAYAQGTFADTSLALFTALAAACAFAAGPERRSGGAGWLWLSGLWLGLAVCVRPAGLLLLVPFVVYLRRAGIARVLVWLVPLAVVVAAALWVDHAVLGRPFAAGYAGRASESLPLLTHSYTLSLFGLLGSDGKGLFVLAPVLWLALLGLPAARRRRPRETDLLVGCLVTLSLFFAAFDGWYNGWCWGPRYLLPAVPLFAVLVAGFLEHGPRWRRLVIVPVVLLSVWIQGLSVAVPHRIYMTMVSRHGAEPTQFFYYTRTSPVLAHQKILLAKLRGGGDTWSQAELFGERSEEPIDVTRTPDLEISRHNRAFDHFAWLRVWQKGHTLVALAGAAACGLLMAAGLWLALRRRSDENAPQASG
jgi:hypothetical protein